MRTKEENIKLAQILFPNVVESVEDITKRYPKRDLKEGELVLRFAPSPTGFVHIGNIYTALINERLARQSSGVFILRIEDTDKEREVEKGIEKLIDGIEFFNMEIDEGPDRGGKYLPYIQSERVEIYKVFAKDLVSKGLAYPCFATPKELEEIREKQKAMGVRTGYYGKFAKWRDMGMKEIEAELEKNTPFTIRLYSTGNVENKINTTDLVKGGVTLVENDMDAVLLKSDGLPTYHFAHPIDDTLMGISFVLRGDEWLSSRPLHMEIFKALGFKPLEYGHISPLMKQDGEGKRKLSKRKDPEADISFYTKEGYPVEGVKEYLLNIANSNFYDWRIANPTKDSSEFELKLEKLNKAGALFDMRKLEDVCKNFISRLTALDVYEEVVKWAESMDLALHERLIKNRDFAIRIFNIEREGERIRKDLVKWSDAHLILDIFFDGYTQEKLSLDRDLQEVILNEFLNTLNMTDSSEEWFAKIKDIAKRNSFAIDNKEFESNPKNFKGKLGDVAMVVRVAITGQSKSPDLYQVIQVMGEDMVRERVSGYLKSL